ncbi:MAG: 1-deoxy-D-xylulose-5-phosphate reductoisomerase [Gammaproteobacteria bacterium]|nr:1-deoxy-D-xylulose-5-phosphate reductoisomerase [Gammaproteobacteria bacterium]
MIGITVLGATGSIGQSTLDVVARHRDRYRVVALTANDNVEGLYRQCLEHRPQFAVLAAPQAAELLATRLRAAGSEVTVLSGVDGLQQVAACAETDYVMAAIVGSAGLVPTLAAVRAGKRILLANKEALVMSGALFMEEVRNHGAELLPIDSEHNAIFQCLPPGYRDGLAQVGVRRILLTASGGPFRTTAPHELRRVTPAEACAHPNWSMGRKISVDSATMMNKGLEVIEACHLFATTPQAIQVVIHPQSIIHSMVEYQDGSVLAQLGSADMRIPIAHALAWPERFDSGAQRLDIFQIGQLSFEAPDLLRFPCLRLAFEAATRGGTAPAILNAANEVAVQAFLAGLIPFTDIARIVEQVLDHCTIHDASSLTVVLADDDLARRQAQQMLPTGSGAASA